MDNHSDSKHATTPNKGHRVPSVEEVIEAVQKIIEPSYVVGGSLRDTLLGRTPSDYDFATPKTPNQVEQAVRESGRRAYVTGRRFGTIGFKVGSVFVEVTSFRGELYQRGSRHPKVTFKATLEDDLSRRDFTVNAMAQDPSGKLIDLFGGQDDLEAGLLRCVGDAHERFTEDPLRILRAARLASQLSFEIEPATFDAMAACSAQLANVAIQRQCKELDLLIVGEQPAAGLDYLERAGALELLLPELTFQLHGPLVEEVMAALRAAKPTPEDRWAAVLGAIEAPYLVHNGGDYDARAFVRAGLIAKIGTYLHWSKARIKAIQQRTGSLPD